MSRESCVWTFLAKSRVSFGDALHMERVENLLGAGTPDVEGYLRLPGHQTPTQRLTLAREGAFQIELKSSERPARSATPIRFKLKGREKQIEFMRRRWALGGNAFFLLQVGSGPDRRFFLAPGDAGAKLAAGLNEAELMIECLRTGVFPARASPDEILTRVIQCRGRQSFFPN